MLSKYGRRFGSQIDFRCDLSVVACDDYFAGVGIGFGNCDRIEEVDRLHNRRQIVIAIPPCTENLEGEIDFGVRTLSDALCATHSGDPAVCAGPSRVPERVDLRPPNHRREPASHPTTTLPDDEKSRNPSAQRENVHLLVV